jgi:hypothetical protein
MAGMTNRHSRLSKRILACLHRRDRLHRSRRRFYIGKPEAAQRAQPIVMTTLAMGAGMLPIALKIGADAVFTANRRLLLRANGIYLIVASIAGLAAARHSRDLLRQRAGGADHRQRPGTQGRSAARVKPGCR